MEDLRAKVFQLSDKEAKDLMMTHQVPETYVHPLRVSFTDGYYQGMKDAMEYSSSLMDKWKVDNLQR